jgi:threonine synthase
VVATAHPAKFESVVEPLADRRVPVPPALAAMLQRSASAEPIAATDEALKRWLLEPAYA